jgi:hypothetical protein
MVSEPVEADFGTEESFAFTQQVRHDDGLLSDLSVFAVARTGNAIYVDTSYGAAGGDSVAQIELERLEQNSAAPLGALCAFAVEPCQD